MSRQHKRSPHKGWAIYLRTSNQEAQNPANSQRRQRHAIQQSLLQRANLPVIDEYSDTLSGRSPDRPDYQRMLRDARLGKFSHVAVENAERFGRNDTEALTAIDELHDLGIAVRFADYPDLDPIDPDDRIMVSLSFTLARRESMKLGQRVKGGLAAKLRNGGWAWQAPDGYINCEERTDTNHQTQEGRYTRWIEQDPDRVHIWREAWDLLLEDRYTLDEICEILHERGYTFRSGRAFVEVKPSGQRYINRNGLSRIFHNWFYAGWVVSDKVGIPPKKVRGQWPAIVTTEEFEAGLRILKSRVKSKSSKRKHIYLLTGLLYIRLQNGKLRRLTGSTSNTRRSGGGTAYYCISNSNVNILCRTVDTKVQQLLQGIQVDPDILPAIRQCYMEEVADKLGHQHEVDQKAQIEHALKAIDSEEERTIRLYAMGKVTDQVWENLWSEWQDKRLNLRASLEMLGHDEKTHIKNLDDALAWIEKLAILYETLSIQHQRELLRLIIEQIVVDYDGNILDLKLRPPFAYIRNIIKQVGQAGKTKQTNHSASLFDMRSSVNLSQCVPGRTRTCDTRLRRPLFYPLNYGDSLFI
jgi:DNA invertase Pin-like site-specific DNA recombinase